MAEPQVRKKTLLSLYVPSYSGSVEMNMLGKFIRNDVIKWSFISGVGAPVTVKQMFIAWDGALFSSC